MSEIAENQNIASENVVLLRPENINGDILTAAIHDRLTHHDAIFANYLSVDELAESIEEHKIEEHIKDGLLSCNEMRLHERQIKELNRRMLVNLIRLYCITELLLTGLTAIFINSYLCAFEQKKATHLRENRRPPREFDQRRLQGKASGFAMNIIQKYFPRMKKNKFSKNRVIARQHKLLVHLYDHIPAQYKIELETGNWSDVIHFEFADKILSETYLTECGKWIEQVLAMEWWADINEATDEEKFDYFFTSDNHIMYALEGVVLKMNSYQLFTPFVVCKNKQTLAKHVDRRYVFILGIRLDFFVCFFVCCICGLFVDEKCAVWLL